MQVLSKKTKYGLRALLALAEREQGEPMLIADLAQQEEIPKKFLELILLALKNKGILQSKKGKGGGYSLGRRSDAISLGEVIRIFEGPLAPLPCVSRMARRTCEECDDERTCGIRAVMQEVRDATAKILDNESLADVLRRTERLEQEKKKVLVYSI